jgi:hypothetical protein
MTIEVVEIEHEGEALNWRWSREASASSSGVGGPCEIGVFRRSYHVYKLRLQLFDIA